VLIAEPGAYGGEPGGEPGPYIGEPGPYIEELGLNGISNIVVTWDRSSLSIEGICLVILCKC
jgi:hypothetical protein|tara:strand:- start:397 stop:582 length:186 start_codon:yes stop_codon:yes gene_type:complete